MEKLKSRKFWLAVSSILASVATAIAGLAIDNEVITIVGVICGVAASAIYEIVEALLDYEREE